MKTATSVAAALSQYLKDEGRYDQLPEVIAALQEEVYRNQEISVILAAAATPAEEKAITAEVTAKWGEHPVNFFVDATILSGMILRFQDNILDLSGRRNLKDLATALNA